jgi:hypothetical protein
MQTFLPYKDFDQCAETLDNKRLNKQILESYQIHVNRVNITHRANLYRKDYIYYAEFYKDTQSEYNKPCCDKCLYYWATHAVRDRVQ